MLSDDQWQSWLSWLFPWWMSNLPGSTWTGRRPWEAPHTPLEHPCDFHLLCRGLPKFTVSIIVILFCAQNAQICPLGTHPGCSFFDMSPSIFDHFLGFWYKIIWPHTEFPLPRIWNTSFLQGSQIPLVKDGVWHPGSREQTYSVLLECHCPRPSHIHTDASNLDPQTSVLPHLFPTTFHLFAPRKPWFPTPGQVLTCSILKHSQTGGSGWGTHVNPWLFHFNVWQNPLQ